MKAKISFLSSHTGSLTHLTFEELSFEKVTDEAGGRVFFRDVSQRKMEGDSYYIFVIMRERVGQTLRKKSSRVSMMITRSSKQRFHNVFGNS